MPPERPGVPDADDYWVAQGVTAFIAPVGTPMSDSAAWQQIGGPSGASFVDGRIVYDEATRDHLASNFCIPQTFMVGIDPAASNERSKPMGLNKEHVYKDQDGDKVTASFAVPDYATATLTVDDGDTACAYVSKADSVPLALNVLGYNRPQHSGVGSVRASVNGITTTGYLPASQTLRDQRFAEAIAGLLAVDVYDQREASRKADEERARKLTEDLVAAQQKLRGISEDVADHGVTAFRADELAKAAAVFKAAYEAHAGS